jgi:hypothetical protein
MVIRAVPLTILLYLWYFPDGTNEGQNQRLVARSKTMKRLTALLIGAFVVLMSTGAFAQDGGDGTKSKFYDFNDMLVDGELKTPDVQRMDARGQAKFKRLLDLKKSFLPKVQESTEEDALD